MPWRCLLRVLGPLSCSIRRAIAYLRWSTNDAETIAPSLWAGRGKRPTAEAEPPATPAPSTLATPPGSGSGTAIAQTSPATVPGASSTPRSAIGIGLPGSSPFTS